ncbi:cell surface A33 antigen-like [Antennarius striatus]|uniref:cell surface A33 antigen-like n=1 Tax=Antennarius striatus TaxID=241820 RepID=UPI0035B2C73C
MVVWDIKIVWIVGMIAAATGDASVSYSDPVCAVRGSTVTLLCTFTPVPSFTVGRVRWCRNHLICQGETVSVFDSASGTNNQRYRYLGDNRRNCSLQITDIQEEDQGELRFRMEAENDDARGHYTGQSGVRITVTERSPMTIRSSAGDAGRGQNVTLVCTAPCTFHQLELTWFKDDHALSESGPALHLGPLTSEDSGNYTCSLKTNPDSFSTPFEVYVAPEEEEVIPGPVGSDPSLALGLVFGVLLALVGLVVVVCIIRRTRAADPHQTAAEDPAKAKRLDYSNRIAPLAGDQEAERQQPEYISYASVTFRLQNQNKSRPAQRTDDPIIYSSVKP